jgi:membrane associated rhomboid family serine protease
MFFPYRARISLHRTPVLTILVCLLCVVVFAAQSSNRRALIQAASEHCEREGGRKFVLALTQVAGTGEPRACVALMLTLYQARDDKAELARLMRDGTAARRAADERLASYYEQALLDSYRSFQLSAPPDLTARLWYPPDSWNPMRMLSAAVAHGSWSHVIGNLIFFFAFAATIEILLGPFLYLGVLIVLALGTHSVYSLAMLQNPQALPTDGLSGVVMGVIALLVFFIPRARISCFLWLVVFYRRFPVPAWLLASWFIGWDIYALSAIGGNTGVNLVAHVSGAAIGFILGVAFFRQKRHWAQELVEERD